jgi:hypothetical protein
LFIDAVTYLDMQDAPDDMFSAALALLGDRSRALADTVAAPAPPELLPQPDRVRIEIRRGRT